LDALHLYRLADVDRFDRFVFLSKTRPPPFFPLPIATGTRALNQDSVKWLALRTLLLSWIEAREKTFHDLYEILLLRFFSRMRTPPEQVNLMSISTFGARVFVTTARACCLEFG
jgi:hypothetical protein